MVAFQIQSTLIQILLIHREDLDFHLRLPWVLQTQQQLLLPYRTLLSNFLAFFNDEEIPDTPGTLATTFLTFVLKLAFALSVLGFLIMHISLVLGNTTTIEAYEKRNNPMSKYNIGRRKNFEQVMVAGVDEEEVKTEEEMTRWADGEWRRIWKG